MLGYKFNSKLGCKPQRNSSVPLFVLADKVTEVLEDLEDILVAYEAAVNDEKHADAMYAGWDTPPI